jgi:hypothetical protein
MFKENFGIELKDKTLVRQKLYPESFDSIPYPRILGCQNLLNSLGRIVELHESMLVTIMHRWKFMVVLII